MTFSDRLALDTDQFEQLREEIGDDDACASFIQSYLDLLPRRLLDLSVAMRTCASPWDHSANLAAASRMLGALALAEHLEQIHDWVDLDPDRLRRHLYTTIELAYCTQIALRQQLAAVRSRSNRHADQF